jgi:predicted CXXCH cytochrome family protein
MKKSPGYLLAILGCLLAASAMAATIVSSRHNLSASGPGTVTASSESQICIFCHTPHRSVPIAPLWNRNSPGLNYVPYSSSTALAAPGQPTGDSLLCLSCHDGTIALGEVLSQTNDIVMAGGVVTMPVGPSLIGTNLTHDHPISFEYSSSLASQNGELRDPGTLRPEIGLDANGQLQCTTCHDAHDDQFGKFLAWPNTRSQLCNECHQKTGWGLTPHSLSASGWNGVLPDPWPASDEVTVTDNACQNCHLPHSATGGPRLLQYAIEEDNCRACHNGNVANQDVMAEFNKLSIHPIIDTALVHDPVEPGTVVDRHVECVDCHDPHATRAGATPITGVLTNVRGIDLSGGEVDPASQSYELCFRCHADNPDPGPNTTPRQHDQLNTRLEFQLGNPSFHPVAGIGRNPDVPSLIDPLTPTSIIECTDCHNSDSSTVAGGAGPSGPHGSAFEPILARRYVTLDNTPESNSAYALCYSCHSRNSILNDESFAEHDKHIRGEDTPCNVCHDPHGVSSTQGNSVNNSHLINFDISVVSPNNNGLLRFVDGGRFSGSCDLACHGQDHDDENY